MAVDPLLNLCLESDQAVARVKLMGVHSLSQDSERLAAGVREAALVGGQGAVDGLDDMFVVAVGPHETLHKVLKRERLAVSVHLLRLLHPGDDVKGLPERRQGERLSGATKV